MSVSKQRGSVTARFARWTLDCAVRYWPEKNRAWGVALAAEIDETRSAFETVRWSMGGILFFSRSVLSSVWAWMKLPAGGSLSGDPVEPSFLPKRSRVFTAAILAAAAILLYLPEGREAMRTVRASWRGYQVSGLEQRMLEDLATRAEKYKDASTLAFVALSTIDRDRAAVLTERAIALNPEYIWVYGARNHGPRIDPPRAEWLARLEAADPGNAVPELLIADALIQPRLSALLAHGGINDEARQLLANDATWMALMDHACAAPRYDSYLQRHFQLAQTVWNREKNLPPTTILYGIWQHAFPDLLALRIYSDIKIRQAQTEWVAGNTKRAESLLAGLDTFGMMMADANGSELEKLIGFAVARSANKAMAQLYQVAGKTVDARRVSTRLDQIDKRVQELRFALNVTRSAREEAFRKEAVFVQGFGALGVISGFAALSAILLLELWPGGIQLAKPFWRRTACWVANYAPATLLVASGAFLVSFLPFQSVFEEYRSSSFRLADEQVLTDAMHSLFRIPQNVLGDGGTVELWSVVTIALSALLLFVLVRGFYRTKRVAAKPA